MELLTCTIVTDKANNYANTQITICCWLQYQKIPGKRCATNADCRLADWQINIVLKCSNPNPNPNANPKKLALGLIGVSVRVRVSVRAL